MSETELEGNDARTQAEREREFWEEPSQVDWFREEYERAKALNAQVPPHARMVVTNPDLSAHTADGARHWPTARLRVEDQG